MQKSGPGTGHLAERLQEEVNTLIEERKFSSRDGKEVKVINEILEADNLREAQEAAYQRLKLLYIANTKGWNVAAKFQREDLFVGRIFFRYVGKF